MSAPFALTCLMAMIIGGGLFVFSLDTVADSLWSRRTRVGGVAGLVVGFGTFWLGFFGIVLAA